MFGARANPLRGLERQIGYRFKDRALLLAALTHPSYRFEGPEGTQDNQRLEYLGDAVLGLLAAQHAYERHADADEGRLTVLRSRVASGRSLAETARSIGLGAYLRMGKGEERSGGRERAGMLADSLEAVFGAAWMDGGLRAGEKIFRKLVVPRLTDSDAGSDNPKGSLQEYAQRVLQCVPEYHCLSVDGPAHAPIHRVRVRVGECEATGEGKTRREAEAAAAGRWLRARRE